MKSLFVFAAAAGLTAVLSAARPAVIVQENRLTMTPPQFRSQPDCPDDLISVEMYTEYPVSIDGVPPQTLDALRRQIPYGATLRAEGPSGEPCSPAQMSNLLMRINEKLAAKAEGGLAMGALTYVQKVTFPYANSRYAVMNYDGYDNEGGNGCHSFGWTHIIRLKDMKILGYADVVRDRRKLGDLLVEALNRVYLTEDDAGRPVPYLSSEKGAFWSTAAVYKGEPAMRPKAEGMEFYFSAYEILPGCCGLPTVLIPWSKLRNVCDPKLVADLKALANE